MISLFLGCLVLIISFCFADVTCDFRTKKMTYLYFIAYEIFESSRIGTVHFDKDKCWFVSLLLFIEYVTTISVFVLNFMRRNKTCFYLLCNKITIKKIPNIVLTSFREKASMLFFSFARFFSKLFHDPNKRQSRFL